MFAIVFLIIVPPKLGVIMKFFRGYALIRGGTIAKNTPCLKGVRLLGGGTISDFNFVACPELASLVMAGLLLLNSFMDTP